MEVIGGSSILQGVASKLSPAEVKPGIDYVSSVSRVVLVCN